MCVGIPTLLIALAMAPRSWFSDADLLVGRGEGQLAAIWTLAHEVLPTWSLSGWSDDMYAGYPVNGLYPPLGATLAALLSHVMPLIVAYKLVVVVPLVLPPFASWLAARWGGLTGSLPALAAIAVIPFAFDTSCPTCGGTVVSAALGGYAYVWGLLLAVTAAGLFARFARTGRGLAVTAAALAIAAFGHPVTALWLVVLVVVLAVAYTPWRTPGRSLRILLLFATAGLIAGSWWIPFLAGRDYMPSQDALGQSTEITALLPYAGWVDVLALTLTIAGFWATWALRSRWLGAIVVTTAMAVAVFLLLPDTGDFSRERVVPLVSYGRWMLAAAGLGWLLALLADRLARPLTWAPLVPLAAVCVVTAALWGMVGVVRAPVPGNGDGQGSVLGLSYPVTQYSAATTLSITGYVAPAGNTDLADLKTVLSETAAFQVCGRLAWDVGGTNVTGLPGDTLALAGSAIMTGGCLRPVLGVLDGSSGSAPSLWTSTGTYSRDAVSPFPWTTPQQLDFKTGEALLQASGVRWFLTSGGDVEQQVRAVKEMVKGPSHGRWTMWGVPAAGIAQAMGYYPVVIDKSLSSQQLYEIDDTYRRAASYLAVPLLQDGPSSWPHTSLTSAPDVVKLKGMSSVLDLTEADLTATPNRLTFKVAVPGYPVVVKVSDYPGWAVDGAEGPFRTTGNFMVVVPTSDTVTLYRTKTAAEWSGQIAGALGLIALLALVALNVRDRRRDDAMTLAPAPV